MEFGFHTAFFQTELSLKDSFNILIFYTIFTHFLQPWTEEENMLYHTVDQLCIFLILGHPGERVKLKYSLETSI